MKARMSAVEIPIMTLLLCSKIRRIVSVMIVATSYVLGSIEKHCQRVGKNIKQKRNELRQLHRRSVEDVKNMLTVRLMSVDVEVHGREDHS